MNVERLKRLLLLVPLAKKHGKAGIPVPEALAALHLDSEAQLLEDVDELVMVGDPSGSPDGFVDVCVEDGRLKVFLAQGFSSPPRFTAAEGAALLAALRPLEASVPAVSGVVEKLAQALPLTQDQHAEAALLERLTRIEARPAPAFRALLEEACEKRLEVFVRYFSAGRGEESTRTLEPRAVFLHAGRWYLAAWSPERAEEQLYRLDRMSDVRLGSRCFGDHKGPPLDRYQLDHLYIPSGEEQDVELRFASNVAASVLQDWGEAAQVNDDGSVTVRAFLAGGHFLVSWVLGYGGDAEIVRPASLRALLAERVEKLQDLYAARPA